MDTRPRCCPGFARDVYAVERIRQLLERAKENLRPLRLPNVRLKYGDGTVGLPEAAPFDSIVVAAAAGSIPQALKAQLADRGRLILPVALANNNSFWLKDRECFPGDPLRGCPVRSAANGYRMNQRIRTGRGLVLGGLWLGSWQQVARRRFRLRSLIAGRGVRRHPHHNAKAGFPWVRPGDTLYSIAQRQGVTVRDLVAWNQIADPNQLEVGTELRVAPLDAVVVSPINIDGPAVEVKPVAPETAPTCLH